LSKVGCGIRRTKKEMKQVFVVLTAAWAVSSEHGGVVSDDS
jgi:hypothetical protein